MIFNFITINLEHFIVGIILISMINIYFKLALKYDILDKPTIRSSHKIGTIRGGGIIFPISVILWFILNNFLYLYFFMGIFIISIISFLDDVYNLKYYQRLWAQSISTLLLFYELSLFIFPLWLWLITFIFIIGWINAFNFMDGINGMSVFYSFISVLFFYFIPELKEFNYLIELLLISLVIFAFYNVRSNALAFLGDVGSISIAYILGYLMLSLILSTHQWEYVLFFSIYGIDTVLTIIQRLIQRENIFQPHRKHLYQYLSNQSDWSHIQVSILYTFLQVLINFSLVLFIIPSENSSIISIVLLIIFSLVYIILKRYYYFDNKLVA